MRDQNGYPFLDDKDLKKASSYQFFITDIVEYMHDDGLSAGYVIGDGNEVMGIDDLQHS